MRRFTADASHEIRNPLSVLRVGLEVALRRPRDATEYRRVIQDNLQEIQRLQAVLEGLLALAREVPGAPHPLVRTAVDFSDVVAQTVEMFSTVASERGIRIDTAIDPDLVVDGDAQLLRLAAFNLVDNAVKHSPPATRVEVRAGVRKGEVTLVVADQAGGPARAPGESVPTLFSSAARRRGRRGRTRPQRGGVGRGPPWWACSGHRQPSRRDVRIKLAGTNPRRAPSRESRHRAGGRRAFLPDR
jgi:signal transduction histidine kinase